MPPDEIQLTTRLTDLHGVFRSDPAVWTRLVEPAIARITEVIASESEIVSSEPWLQSFMEGALSTEGAFHSAVVWMWVWRFSPWEVFSVALVMSVDASGTVLIGDEDWASRVAMKRYLLTESSVVDPTSLVAKSVAVQDDWHLGKIAAQLDLFCMRAGLGPNADHLQMQSW